MEEYEQMKASRNEKNEKFEAKEKGWQKTIEEIFSLVKGMNGSADDAIFTVIFSSRHLRFGLC